MDKKEWDWLIQLTMENQITQVLQANQYTREFQFSLSREEAQALTIGRKEELQRQERVEFGEGIMKKIIYEFCDSPYIYQENYVDSLLHLQEIRNIFHHFCHMCQRTSKCTKRVRADEFGKNGRYCIQFEIFCIIRKRVKFKNKKIWGMTL